jgi:hypothetical protein
VAILARRVRRLSLRSYARRERSFLYEKAEAVALLERMNLEFVPETFEDEPNKAAPG